MNRVTFGRKVKSARKNKKLSQQQVADFIQSDQESICRLEKGRLNLPLDKTLKLCTLLQIELR